MNCLLLLYGHGVQLLESLSLTQTQEGMFDLQNHPSQTCHTHEPHHVAKKILEQLMETQIPYSMQLSNCPPESLSYSL